MLTIKRPRPAKLGRSFVRGSATGAAIALAVIGVAAVLRTGEPGRVLASWLEDATRVRRAIAAHLEQPQVGAVVSNPEPWVDPPVRSRNERPSSEDTAAASLALAASPAIEPATPPPSTTILERASPAPRASLQQPQVGAAVPNPEPWVDPPVRSRNERPSSEDTAAASLALAARP